MATLADSWRLATTLLLAKATDQEKSVAFPHRFTSRLIRTEATSKGIPEKWRRAGYLKQLISLVPADETKSLVVPVNTRKIFVMPKINSYYQLIFTPVSWLPAGLQLRIWEYAGPEPDEALLKELMLMQ